MKKLFTMLALAASSLSAADTVVIPGRIGIPDTVVELLTINLIYPQDEERRHEIKVKCADYGQTQIVNERAAAFLIPTGSDCVIQTDQYKLMGSSVTTSGSNGRGKEWYRR